MNIKSVGAAGLAFALSIAASGQALASVYNPATDFEGDTLRRVTPMAFGHMVIQRPYLAP
jgi:hypothetical protein